MREQKRAKRRVISMVEIHRTPGKVFKDVARSKRPVVVESNGLPIAVIKPYDEQEEIAEALQLLDELTSEAAPIAKAKGLTEEKVVEDLRRIRKRLHQKKYGKAAK